MLHTIDFENVPEYLAVEIYTRSTAFHLVQHKIEEAYRCSAVIMQYISESMPTRYDFHSSRSKKKFLTVIPGFWWMHYELQQKRVWPNVNSDWLI